MGSGDFEDGFDLDRGVGGEGLQADGGSGVDAAVAEDLHAPRDDATGPESPPASSDLAGGSIVR